MSNYGWAAKWFSIGILTSVHSVSSVNCSRQSMCFFLTTFPTSSAFDCKGLWCKCIVEGKMHSPKLPAGGIRRLKME